MHNFGSPNGPPVPTPHGVLQALLVEPLLACIVLDEGVLGTVGLRTLRNSQAPNTNTHVVFSYDLKLALKYLVAIIFVYAIA